MPHSSHVLHEILTEEDEIFNSVNEDSHSPVYDTALFDVLKVDAEDFAVSQYFSHECVEWEIDYFSHKSP